MGPKMSHSRTYFVNTKSRAAKNKYLSGSQNNPTNNGNPTTKTFHI